MSECKEQMNVHDDDLDGETGGDKGSAAKDDRFGFHLHYQLEGNIFACVACGICFVCVQVCIYSHGGSTKNLLRFSEGW